jgi:hypothetical protein
MRTTRERYYECGKSEKDYFDDIRQYLIDRCSKTNPNNNYFSATITLAGMDINSVDIDSIEDAIMKLAKKIYMSVFLSNYMQRILYK